MLQTLSPLPANASISLKPRYVIRNPFTTGEPIDCRPLVWLSALYLYRNSILPAFSGVNAFSPRAQPSRWGLPLWLGQSAAHIAHVATAAVRPMYDNFLMRNLSAFCCLNAD